MTNLIVFLTGIVILFFLFVWLFKVFASMSEDEKEIYEGSKCPFDSDHCGVIGRALQKEFPTKICRECPIRLSFT